MRSGTQVDEVINPLEAEISKEVEVPIEVEKQKEIEEEEVVKGHVPPTKPDLEVPLGRRRTRRINNSTSSSKSSRSFISTYLLLMPCHRCQVT